MGCTARVPVPRALQQAIRLTALPLSSGRTFATTKLVKPGADPYEWDSNLHWRDPLLIDDRLTEEEILIKDATRQFCESTLAPIVQKNFRDETFDKNLFKEFG